MCVLLNDCSLTDPFEVKPITGMKANRKREIGCFYFDENNITQRKGKFFTLELADRKFGEEITR
jgi:hypothetical protein